jgi:hypothetical protein
MKNIILAGLFTLTVGCGPAIEKEDFIGAWTYYSGISTDICSNGQTQVRSAAGATIAYEQKGDLIRAYGINDTNVGELIFGDDGFYYKLNKNKLVAEGPQSQCWRIYNGNYPYECLTQEEATFSMEYSNVKREGAEDVEELVITMAGSGHHEGLLSNDTRDVGLSCDYTIEGKLLFNPIATNLLD